jgi:hypothetical protein
MTLLARPTPIRGALTQEPAPDQNKYAAANLEDREVEQFFVSFKTAIAKGDKKTVSSMVSYPLTVILASGRRTKITNKAQLLRQFDAIFDPSFKRVIQQTKVDDLYASPNGVTTPDGDVWFSAVFKDMNKPEYEIKITAINNARAK